MFLLTTLALLFQMLIMSISSSRISMASLILLSKLFSVSIILSLIVLMSSNSFSYCCAKEHCKYEDERSQMFFELLKFPFLGSFLFKGIFQISVICFDKGVQVFKSFYR